MRLCTIFLMFMLLLPGCRKPAKPTLKITREQLIHVNRRLIQNDSIVISEYNLQQNLSLSITPSGLWLQILEPGNGILPVSGQQVSIAFTLSLLDGTVCYTSAQSGLKKFVVGQGGVESGLEEAVMHLGRGGKAIALLPPHLAHGLVGDEDKIPARAIVRYDIEVVEISEP